MGCNNSIIINAPAETVWNTIKDFFDMSWAPNAITKLDPTGTSGSTIGAQRVLNDAFYETLRSVDNDAMTFTYSIDDGPECLAKDKVTNYVSRVQVMPVTADNTAYVVWTSNWDAGEEGIEAFCSPIYQALLNDMNISLSLQKAAA